MNDLEEWAEPKEDISQVTVPKDVESKDVESKRLLFKHIRENYGPEMSAMICHHLSNEMRNDFKGEKE